MAHESVWDVPKEMIVDSLLARYFERLFAYHLAPERDEGKDEEGKKRQEEIRNKIRDLAWHANAHPEEFNIMVGGVSTLIDIVATRAPILPRWLRSGIDEVLGQTPRTLVNVLKQKQFQDAIPPGYVPDAKSPAEALTALVPLLEADTTWIKDFITKNWIHLKAAIEWAKQLWNEGLDGLGVVVEGTLGHSIDDLNAQLRRGLDERRAARRGV